MIRFSGPPKIANLSEALHHHLNMYAIAAGAAGVGILALAQPAEGKIVYTPAHKNAVLGINLDLNHDGIADFRICYSDNTYHCSATGASRPPGFLDALTVKPFKGNAVFASQRT
jgi:hypothetical protein